jgi:hypothetical protein
MENPNSVTTAFQALVDAHELTSVEDGWRGFLSYMEKRLGSDLRTVRWRDDWNAALRCITEGVPNRLGQPSDDPQAEWFAGFDRRPDVLTAFAKYRRDSQGG